jgi:hypothetical protein
MPVNLQHFTYTDMLYHPMLHFICFDQRRIGLSGPGARKSRMQTRAASRSRSTRCGLARGGHEHRGVELGLELLTLGSASRALQRRGHVDAQPLMSSVTRFFETDHLLRSWIKWTGPFHRANLLCPVMCKSSSSSLLLRSPRQQVPRGQTISPRITSLASSATSARDAPTRARVCPVIDILFRLLTCAFRVPNPFT